MHLWGYSRCFGIPLIVHCNRNRYLVVPVLDHMYEKSVVWIYHSNLSNWFYFYQLKWCRLLSLLLKASASLSKLSFSLIFLSGWDTVFPDLFDSFPQKMQQLFDQLVKRFYKSSECYVVKIIQKIAHDKKYSAKTGQYISTFARFPYALFARLVLWYFLQQVMCNIGTL